MSSTLILTWFGNGVFLLPFCQVRLTTSNTPAICCCPCAVRLVLTTTFLLLRTQTYFVPLCSMVFCFDLCLCFCFGVHCCLTIFILLRYSGLTSPAMKSRVYDQKPGRSHELFSIIAQNKYFVKRQRKWWLIEVGGIWGLGKIGTLAFWVLIDYNYGMEITQRQKEILCQIIEEYAETASPVGSVTLAKLFGVSPATIRAEMARLEAFGLIAQPHTSAGRVPTDAGYRFYVNNLDGANNIGRDEAERRSLERGTHALEVRASSQSRADTAIRGAVDALVELTGNLGLATIGGQLYLAGISRLFTQPEFCDTRRVQAVAKLLDNLEPWLREAAPGEALNIFIGHENPIGKNSEVSLIISKFRSPFSDRSYIGVLGPTRQNYSRVMSLVKYAGNMLEEIL